MTPTEATVRARAAIARQPDAALLLEALGLDQPAPGDDAPSAPTHEGARARLRSGGGRRGAAVGLGAARVVTGGGAHPSGQSVCLRCGLIRATHGGRDTALCKSCRDYAQFAGELATWCAA